MQDKELFSSRMARVKASPTLAITRLTLELKAAGRDILPLVAGEPDFETPDHVKQAAIEAMTRGETRYTAVDGTPRLKQAIVDKFRRDSGLSFHAAQIIVGAGGKQVIANALLATLSAGDEVIIPASYWVSYPDMVLLAEGKPVIAPTKAEEGFKLHPAQLERLLTPRTKWLLLNSPCNPSGAVYTCGELRALADVLRGYPDVWILSDDVYESIFFDGGSFATMAQVAPELTGRILTVNAVSKAYNMTGWRIGYGAGPEALIKKMSALQSHLSGNACSISQAAAVAALEGPQDFIVRQREAYQARRDFLVKELSAMTGITCAKPSGAFYVFPSCAKLIGKKTHEGLTLTDDESVARYLLESEGIALVHGSAFGMGDHLRLSFAVSMETLTEACVRLRRALGRLT